MTDEEKVRAAWESVYKYGEYISIDCGSSRHGFGSWAVAAAFTAKQEQAIKDVDEEIRVAKSCSAVLQDLAKKFRPGEDWFDYLEVAAFERILARLEAHRAELARGMKEKA